MTDGLRPVAKPRLYERVLSSLREYVATSGLRAGDRLPAERELAVRLAVSRTSVRQAIVALEVQGLVEVRHGGGVYLRQDSLDVEPIDSLLDRKRRLPGVLEARDAMETKLAELAALRRTRDDLAAIDAALEAMRVAVERAELGEVEDQMFHGAVTTAAHSPVLAEFMGQIADQIAESRRESLTQPGRPAQSLEQHRAIAAAILGRDAQRAAAAMHIHVHSVGQVKLLDWSPDEQ